MSRKTLLALTAALTIAGSAAYADDFADQMEQAQKDMQTQIIENSVKQFAPDHWGADRNWYVQHNGVCVKPKLDPASTVIVDLAMGDFASMDVEAVHDKDGILQIRVQVKVTTKDFTPLNSIDFYTDIQRCKSEIRTS